MTSPARNAARGVGRSARVLIAAIEVYRHMISPLRLPSCRFMPTCSQYAVEALTEYGLLRGGWLALRRLARYLLDSPRVVYDFPFGFGSGACNHLFL